MLFYISLIGFVIFLMMESVTSWMFIQGSKKKYPPLWDHAGKPTLMRNGDLLSAYPLINYIWRRNYSELKDQQAIEYADKLRLATVLSYWLAWGFALALLLSVFIGSASA